MVRAGLATRERDLAVRAADWLDRYREATAPFLNQAGEITDAEEHDEALRPLHEAAVALIRELAATRPKLHTSLAACPPTKPPVPQPNAGQDRRNHPAAGSPP